MIRSYGTLLYVLFAWVVWGGPVAAATIVARVGGEPIYDAQVERELTRVVGTREIAPSALPALRAQMLEQIIKRRLILAFLARRPYGASQQDLDLEVSRIKKKLALQNLTLEDYLRKSKMNEADLRRTLAWQLGWQRYLEQKITDETLQKYFDANRRQFDGTQVEVAHILWKLPASPEPETIEALQEKAAQIRRQIEAGEISFAEAASQHSAAPTAGEGGRIGLIQRRQPMPESFSRVAFQLQAGQVSDPVVTSFGVHLIKCLRVQPGNKVWQDGRQELQPALTRYLFDWLAQRERQTARIEFTGDIKPVHSAAAESKE